MKAFLHRLQRSSKDKDGRDRGEREKLENKPSEKTSSTVLPAIPSAFKADDFFSDPLITSQRPESTPAHPTPVLTHLSAARATSTSSNVGSRPPSQLEASLNKPLPELSVRPLPTIHDREDRLGRDVSESTALTASSLTAVSSRPTRDSDSQARNTLSKQSQPQPVHMNSISTDNTSSAGGSSGGGAAGTSAAASGNPKKVAFISPPPTPGGLSIMNPLPNMVTDLSADADGAATANSHHHSHSLSKATSFPNGTGGSGASALATGSTTNLSLKGGTTGRSSSTTPSKVNTSTTSVKATSSSNGGARAAAVTSPSYAARMFGPSASSASQHRTLSRPDLAQSTVSFRSGTPYSHMSGRSTTIQPPASWSESAEEDLVSNLGPRERTRQEVLWEIVASEQRYVAELSKLKETFIDPLLHPYASSPPPFSSPAPDDRSLFRSASPTESFEHLPIASRFLSSPTPGQQPNDSEYHRQRTASEVTKGLSADVRSIDSEEEEVPEKSASTQYLGGLKGMFKDRGKFSGHGATSGKGPPAGRSPYGVGGRTISAAKGKDGSRYKSSSAPFPSRSHQSLPAPAKTDNAAATLSRQSLIEGSETARDGAATSMSARTSDRKYSTSTTMVGSSTTPSSRMFGGRKLHKHPPILEGVNPLLFDGTDGYAIPPHLLPEDLRICLEVLETCLKGHITLCEGLRKRYEEQYPLVRSLADVFVANSRILQGYATYVLHLERALEQVDNALKTPETTKKPKNQDAADWAQVCRLFKHLEEVAGDKGETGLAISLSKPFQRLLKYPLMFQNLLFHTDPSTFEYEATLGMVAEVEKIVRSIEDEKIQKEERDRTRDIFARIEGLEKVKMLAIPKPSRVLVEEKVLVLTDSSASDGAKGSTSHTASQVSYASSRNVKQKTSLKRLSDVLPGTSLTGKNGVGGKNDLWLVRFNDVVLRCQRTGTTTLPLVTGGTNTSSTGVGARSNSLPDFNAGKAKFATTGRRQSQSKPRNLYKFVKIETWVIGNVAKPRAGMVSMEDISRSRSSGVVAIEPVKSGDTDEEDGNSSDDSDRKSKMSFSYWGADKITVDPVASAKARAQASKTPRGRSSLAPVAYARPESTARAKFGHRLRSVDAEDDLPNSLRTASARKAASTQTGNRRLVAGSSDDTTSNVGHRKSTGNSRNGSVTSPTASASPRRAHNQSITSTTSAVPSRLKVASPAPSEDSGVVWFDPSVIRL
ncbi:hypothetical protein FRB99_002415 [Tulasnella sp. 403]|nr:hypothetical protein FRB99_002415 [Tulasnella sp. 403]